MTILPTGTLTFLFTDIEGSTKLWEQHPEAMKIALARHDELLRHAVEANQGQLVKTTGDGLHAVFDTAANAVAAACAAQRALQAEPWVEIQPQQLRVRMGLHSGTAEARAGDFYGSALNRAARLMAMGSGCQVLISSATTELVREDLPEGTSLLDLGEHRLRDLTRPEHIFQLVYPGVRQDFPPIASLDRFPHNLPFQLTGFIGREREIAEVLGLLGMARLITLTGSGGTGKTRLSLEVAAQALDDFPQGAWCVELAPVFEPSQIVPALAQVFGLKEQPTIPLKALLVDFLREKQLLLLLDNCEHLVEACARLADEWLRQCPRLKILASSREALGIAGEVSYRIPPLESSEAIQLFLERAQAANPKFQMNEANAPAIRRICTRLDGIPLAIELAAARVRLLSPEQIASRLDDRFRLLIGGSRTALPRQQTLQAMIDWSYDLLSPGEQRLLRIASVFVGGWSLEAMEGVSEDPNTLEILDHLVNKSLVTTEAVGEEMRFSLLETIRQYAREKLLHAGLVEAARVRALHLDFFCRLAQEAAPRLRGSEMIRCLNQLEQEQENLRAALEWALETDLRSALHMAPALGAFWGRQAYASEGYALLRKALQLAEESIPLEENQLPETLQLKARAFEAEATLAFRLGQNIAARSAIEAAVDLARQAGATRALASALALGATICGFLGDLETARAWSRESAAISRQYGFTYELAMIVGFDMFLAVAANQPVPPGLMEESLRTARASGNPWVLAMATTNVGRIRAMEGALEEAQHCYEEARQLFLQLNDRMMEMAVRSEIGHLLRKQGQDTEAARIYAETVRSYYETGQHAAALHELECFAFLAHRQGQPEHAATLLGAAEALREQIHSVMTLMEQREYEQVLAEIRAALEPTVFKNNWLKGRYLLLGQAIDLALEGAALPTG